MDTDATTYSINVGDHVQISGTLFAGRGSAVLL